MIKIRYSDAQLIEAVRNSSNYRQVLIALDRYAKGGSYKQLKKRIKEIPDLDTSHFTGKRHGTSIPPNTRSLESIMVEDSDYGSSDLKRRLIKNGILVNECAFGHSNEWMGKPLSLHLDHINGNNKDNRLENLRILCPNCHTQTRTYCRGTNVTKSTHCIECNKTITKGYTLCHTCDGLQRRGKYSRIVWPPIESLYQSVMETSFREVGKQLGVSDVAVKKHLKMAGKEITKYKKRKSKETS